jgi:hypothetical protein
MGVGQAGGGRECDFSKSQIQGKAARSSGVGIAPEVLSCTEARELLFHTTGQVSN